ncbi:unnamed protein product [Lota lota]
MSALKTGLVLEGGDQSHASLAALGASEGPASIPSAGRQVSPVPTVAVDLANVVLTDQQLAHGSRGRWHPTRGRSEETKQAEPHRRDGTHNPKPVKST